MSEPYLATTVHPYSAIKPIVASVCAYCGEGFSDDEYPAHFTDGSVYHFKCVKKPNRINYLRDCELELVNAPWTATMRDSNMLVHQRCRHGVDHPVWASAMWIAKFLEDDAKRWLRHDCDGCCQDPTWVLESLKESIRKANEIILKQKKMLEGL